MDLFRKIGFLSALFKWIDGNQCATIFVSDHQLLNLGGRE